MARVKASVKATRRRDATSPVTRISAKNQTTLPVAILARAGLGAGDEVRVEAIGAGRILLARATTPAERFSGCLTGVYGRAYVSRLRREWR